MIPNLAPEQRTHFLRFFMLLEWAELGLGSNITGIILDVKGLRPEPLNAEEIWMLHDVATTDCNNLGHHIDSFLILSPQLLLSKQMLCGVPYLVLSIISKTPPSIVYTYTIIHLYILTPREHIDRDPSRPYGG